MAQAKTPTSPLKERAIRAMLDIAAEKGWAEVSFQAIAKKCRCKLADLNALFEDRADLLVAYGRQIDHIMLDRLSVDDTDPERDRLFEVIMERFDIINADRAAVRAIVKSLIADPKMACISMPHIGRSMIWTLEAASIDANGPRGTLKALGLMGIYLYTLRAWMNDDSADMSKTMAALDKVLGRVEKLAAYL